MKNFVAISAIFMMLAVQHGFCNSLDVNFDNIKVRESDKPMEARKFRIIAEFDKYNNIIIMINFLTGNYNIQLEVAPFLNTTKWEINSDYFKQAGESTGKYRNYTFSYNKTINNATAESPCMKIDQTNDSLCNFNLRMYDLGERTLESGKSAPLYLRVQNSSMNGSPTIKLFGGSYKATIGPISQLDTHYASADNLDLYLQNDTNPTERERLMVVKNKNERGTEMLSQIKLAYFMSECPNFKKLTSFTSSETIPGGLSVKVNLEHLGIPFDTDRNCSFTLVFTDIHNGTNLIPVRASQLFAVGANPNYNVSEKVHDYYMDYQILLVKNRQMEKILRTTQEEMVKIEGIAKGVKEIKIHHLTGRSLASKGLRYLMSKAAYAAIRRA